MYIRDDVSAAELVDALRLTAAFVSARIPLSRFGVGPKANGCFLTALANQKGGVLAIDGDRGTAF